jgi:hypothetical protein
MPKCQNASAVAVDFFHSAFNIPLPMCSQKYEKKMAQNWPNIGQLLALG